MLYIREEYKEREKLIRRSESANEDNSQEEAFTEGGTNTDWANRPNNAPRFLSQQKEEAVVGLRA